MKNKTKNYTLSVEMKATQKEMLSSYPNALRTLHYSNGFNYQEPYRIYKHVGKFTINSLSKLYDIDYERDIAVVLSVYCSQWDMRDINEKEKEPRKELYLFELPNGDNVKSYQNIFVRSNIHYPNVYDFSIINDFNDVRKSDKSIIYIIIQEKQYRNSIEPREINKYMDCFDNYYPSLKGFEHFKFRNVFDKSGYNVDAFHSNLNQRLRAFKSENDKKRLNPEEVKKQYNYHLNNIDNLKINTLNKLSTCNLNNVELFNELSNILNRLSNYASYINRLNEVESLSMFERWNNQCNHSLESLNHIFKYLG